MTAGQMCESDRRTDDGCVVSISASEAGEPAIATAAACIQEQLRVGASMLKALHSESSQRADFATQIEAFDRRLTVLERRLETLLGQLDRVRDTSEA